MKKNKREPLKILGICHGETEEVFLEELTREYFILKLQEENLIKKHETAIAEPRVIFFNNHDKGPIQTINFEKRLLQNFEHKNFSIVISSNEDELKKVKIFFLIIMDINEKDSNPRKEKEMIDDNAKNIIINSLKNAKIIQNDNSFDNSQLFFDSKFIYFKNSIEKHFEELDNNKNKKPARMRNFMRNKGWNDSNQIREYFSSNNFKDLENTNISEIFDVLDKILDKFINYLNN